MGKLNYSFADVYGHGFSQNLSTSEQSIPEANEKEHYGETEGHSPETTVKKPQIYTALVIFILLIILLSL